MEDAPTDAEAELTTAWRLLMGLVLGQRWRWSEVAGELGVTQAGLRALLAINPDSPRPMRDLAVAMNCDPSYVTAMVDDLERAGYATRHPAPDDRRVKTVALTPAGVIALGTARDGLLSPPPELARLPPSRQRQLSRLLRDALQQP
ncbi:MAG: MarR family winged helix-turn-helix transcriptional regulator [Pseudonocardiaceae bacterium]